MQDVHAPYGAAEYCSSYSTKAESPDLQTLENMFVKKLSKILLRRDDLTYTDQLRTILKSIYCSTKIGTVHACFALLKQNFVESSTTIEPINPLCRSVMMRQVLFNVNDLASLDPMASAEKPTGLTSTFGKRNAYAAFVKQQNTLGGDGCAVTMFSLYTSYSIRLKIEGRSSKLEIPKLLRIDGHGFIVCPKTFCIDSTIYCARKHKIVLHLSPHIAVNADDEKSCYAVLLLHTPWPQGDEDAILGSPPTTAVERLAHLRRCKKLPAYVESFLDKVEYSVSTRHSTTWL